MVHLHRTDGGHALQCPQDVLGGVPSGEEHIALHLCPPVCQAGHPHPLHGGHPLLQQAAHLRRIALRLAQFDFLKTECGQTPILLLDDIFDKLDANRVANIMRIVSEPAFGQIFVSDTNRQHLDETVEAVGSDYRIFTVDNGVCRQEGGMQ